MSEKVNIEEFSKVLAEAFRGGIKLGAAIMEAAADQDIPICEIMFALEFMHNCLRDLNAESYENNFKLVRELWEKMRTEGLLPKYKIGAGALAYGLTEEEVRGMGIKEKGDDGTNKP